QTSTMIPFETTEFSTSTGTPRRQDLGTEGTTQRGAGMTQGVTETSTTGFETSGMKQFETVGTTEAFTSTGMPRRQDFETDGTTQRGVGITESSTMGVQTSTMKQFETTEYSTSTGVPRGSDLGTD